MSLQRLLMRCGAVSAVLSSMACAPAAWAACYVVYDNAQQVVYRSQTPPVDLSKPLHETLPGIAPGGALVFSLGNSGCEREFNRLPATDTLRHGAAQRTRTAASRRLKRS
ncbi:hypothetical protein [Comamonas faecalis]